MLEIEYDDKVKDVLKRLYKNHYDKTMWDIAMTLNVEQLQEVLDVSKQLAFITQYVMNEKGINSVSLNLRENGEQEW